MNKRTGSTKSQLVLGLSAALLTAACGCVILSPQAGAQSRDSQVSGPSVTPRPGEPTSDTATRVTVSFVGGYETDPRDRGRPVILIASALGVTPDVFRATFRNVSPTLAGQEPEPQQVNRNKEALLAGLGPYGITNDRLDTVSNFYRYNGSRGEMWRNSRAAGYALVRDGKVVGFKITDPGYGYSSTPRIIVPGFTGINATARVAYSTDFRTNGSIKSISLNTAIQGASRGSESSGPSPEGTINRYNPSSDDRSDGLEDPEASSRPTQPALMVPGEILTRYLDLSTDQQTKLERLMRVMDVLRRENFAVPEVGKLRLSDDQIRRVALGEHVRLVLNSEQIRVFDANPRPAFGGPGGPPPPPR